LGNSREHVLGIEIGSVLMIDDIFTLFEKKPELIKIKHMGQKKLGE
jgi:hypothetical protein